MSDDSPSHYYIRVRGRVQGPFDIEQLKKLRERGKFSRANEISSDQVVWQSAAVLEDVFAASRRLSRSQSAPVDEAPDVVQNPAPAPPNRSDLLTPVWYYTIGTEQAGPVTLLELKNLSTTGALAASDLVWREGFPDWKAACDIRELATSSAVPSVNAEDLKAVDFDISTAKHAGFWWRFLAYLIDALVLSPANALITFLTLLAVPAVYGALAIDPTSVRENSFTAFLATVVWVLLLVTSNGLTFWCYYAMMESSSRGGTLGKMACGLVVTDMSGRKISFGQATGRYFARIVTCLVPFGLGYLMCVWSIRQQCLHDKLANCLVLKSE